MGSPAVRLGLWVRQCSTRSCRAWRSRSATTGAGGATSASPTTCAVAAIRLRSLQHHDAGRFAAARRRRLRHQRPLQRLQRQVRADQQLRDLGEQLRDAGQSVARRGRQRHGAAAGRVHLPGRHQHRPQGHGQLRGASPTIPAVETATSPNRSRPRSRASRVYTIPKVDVLVSGTYQSQPGEQLAANWNVPNAIVQQTLGRPLSGGAANVSVNLLNPGQMYGGADRPSGRSGREDSEVRRHAHEHRARVLQHPELRRRARPTTRPTARRARRG